MRKLLAGVALAACLSGCAAFDKAATTVVTDVNAAVSKACDDYEKAKPAILTSEVVADVAAPTIGAAATMVTSQYLDPLCADPTKWEATSAAWVATNVANVQADLAKAAPPA